MDLERFTKVHHPMRRPLLVITAPGGSLCCGYVSVDALNRNGDAGAIVSGVDNHQQMLEAKVKAVSDAASELGVREGMTGEEALRLFDTDG